jgi:hypothetical protein
MRHRLPGGIRRRPVARIPTPATIRYDTLSCRRFTLLVRGQEPGATPAVVTIDYVRRASTIADGDRFWGQARGFPGSARAPRGRDERYRKDGVVQGIQGGKPISGISQTLPKPRW